VVAGIVDVAAARVNEALGAAVFGEIVYIGLPVVARGQAPFAVLKIVTADHHTECGQRVEIPFRECIAGLCLVQALAFTLADIVGRQVPVFADELRHFVPGRVLAARGRWRGCRDTRAIGGTALFYNKGIDSGDCRKRLFLRGGVPIGLRRRGVAGRKLKNTIGF